MGGSSRTAGEVRSPASCSAFSMKRRRAKSQCPKHIRRNMQETVKHAASLLEFLTGLFPDSSKTTLRQMLQAGRVRVNGEAVIDAKRALVAGDEIAVLSRAEAVTLPPTLSLLHEDDDIIVVIKANGLLSIATAREKEDTAQAYLSEYMRQKSGGRIHVVHR